MIAGEWKTALIDIDRASEFTGDDVDQYSKLVDLGLPYEQVAILLPALTAATITVYTQITAAIDEVPVPVHRYKPDTTGNAVQATTSAAGSIAVVLDIPGMRYIRLKASVNQAADRSIKVRGVRS